MLCVSGDGSFMMNVQELTTIKRKRLPVKILLLDNQRLGMVRQWQELFLISVTARRYWMTILILLPRRARLISRQLVTEKSALPSAINTLLHHQGPYLLHVAIREEDNVWPLVPPERVTNICWRAHYDAASVSNSGTFMPEIPNGFCGLCATADLTSVP